jgi:16S rRNA pseudouridine516 synthase
MIAAVGNRVEGEGGVGGLHRSRIGSLVLPDDLKAGQWRWLTAGDLAAISD